MALPFLSQGERRGYRVWTCPQQGWLQMLWRPSRPNKGRFFFPLSTLETQCSYLFLSELGKNNEREILFLPLSLGWGESSSIWGRRLGQQKLTDIFRDMGIK